MDALGAYASESESESEREAGDRDAGDDDAFVGPARPPPRVVGKPPVDDEEDARRDDVAFLESMCGDEEDARASMSGRALEPNAPARLLVALPSEAEETEETRETQTRVNRYFFSRHGARGKRRARLCLRPVLFRNPEFTENCARDGVVAECAFASGTRAAVDDEPLDASGLLLSRAPRRSKKRATEKYLAERNGIAFQSARPSTVNEEDARKAAVNSAIAKARVESAIALQRAGK